MTFDNDYAGIKGLSISNRVFFTIITTTAIGFTLKFC